MTGYSIVGALILLAAGAFYGLALLHADGPSPHDSYAQTQSDTEAAARPEVEPDAPPIMKEAEDLIAARERIGKQLMAIAAETHEDVKGREAVPLVRQRIEAAGWAWWYAGWRWRGQWPSA